MDGKNTRSSTFDHRKHANDTSEELKKTGVNTGVTGDTAPTQPILPNIEHPPPLSSQRQTTQIAPSEPPKSTKSQVAKEQPQVSRAQEEKQVLFALPKPLVEELLTTAKSQMKYNNGINFDRVIVQVLAVMSVIALIIILIASVVGG